MPDCLWLLIKDDYECIKELTAATYRIMTEAMSQSAKQNIIPGMINALHTYGKDMKVNIHFHTIVTQGGMDKNNQWRSVTYIPYTILRVKWKIYCLKVISKHINKTGDNQILLDSLYHHEYRNGFNVRVIKTGIPKKELITYIARYIRHPAISNRRIINYDGSSVSIICGNKKDKPYAVTFTKDEFITRLVQHIPVKNFKLIRHYGLYSRRKIKKSSSVKLKQESITSYFKSQHSIECPSCGKILYPLEYFPPNFANGPPQLKENLLEWID